MPLKSPEDFLARYSGKSWKYGQYKLQMTRQPGWFDAAARGRSEVEPTSGTKFPAN